MNFKTSRTIMWIGIVIGVFVALAGCNGGDEVTNPWIFGIGMTIFLLSLLQAFVFYRCPHCNYSLMNVKGNVPKYCPSCGAAMDLENNKK